MGMGMAFLLEWQYRGSILFCFGLGHVTLSIRGECGVSLHFEKISSKTGGHGERLTGSGQVVSHAWVDLFSI
jgi:hypothetical protein